MSACICRHSFDALPPPDAITRSHRANEATTSTTCLSEYVTPSMTERVMSQRRVPSVRP